MMAFAILIPMVMVMLVIIIMMVMPMLMPLLFSFLRVSAFPGRVPPPSLLILRGRTRVFSTLPSNSTLATHGWTAPSRVDARKKNSDCPEPAACGGFFLRPFNTSASTSPRCRAA